MREPLDLAFDSAGNLYVTTDVASQVLRYDSSGNPFPGPQGDPATAEFVPSGGGGLTGGRGIVFDANGDLYVASIGTDRVLKYSGIDGVFLEEFVTDGFRRARRATLNDLGPGRQLVRW